MGTRPGAAALFPLQMETNVMRTPLKSPRHQRHLWGKVPEKVSVDQPVVVEGPNTGVSAPSTEVPAYIFCLLANLPPYQMAGGSGWLSAGIVGGSGLEEQQGGRSDRQQFSPRNSKGNGRQQQQQQQEQKTNQIQYYRMKETNAGKIGGKIVCINEAYFSPLYTNYKNTVDRELI
ncbi:hypothetical protein OUZ56_020262 [Daphnia magna]|uniref:Uncharacterized protein n=1 Tax=Daphnia magna TaxID=35525 RepID=A0ABQ9ZE01_9CRUS|nr:hypothetical protein OUZ56_020262 [Daphnia magna]